MRDRVFEFIVFIYQCFTVTKSYHFHCQSARNSVGGWLKLRALLRPLPGRRLSLVESSVISLFVHAYDQIDRQSFSISSTLEFRSVPKPVRWNE
jgi:hypothetical protein